METKILKHLVITLINKKFRNIKKQRKFLIDCIESSGYIKENNFVENENENDNENYEDLYQHIMPSNVNVNVPTYDSEFKPSVFSQDQSSIDHGFNRTFIHIDSHAADKLAELQKRGITYEETQFIKVKEQMEELLAPMVNDYDKILQTAINIYLNIIIYYHTNPFGFKEIKGSLKKGYIFMCVYYSLIYNNHFIEKEQLLSGNFHLKDLPLAEKNMKKINLSFNFKINPNPNNFLNFSLNIKSKELLKTIENVIEETKDFIPSTKLGIYSIIYFVCNNYFNYRVKITFKFVETLVTYKILNEMFGSFASATVRKLTDQLTNFYKK